jgi:hypothetical protein
MGRQPEVGVSSCSQCSQLCSAQQFGFLQVELSGNNPSCMEWPLPARLLILRLFLLLCEATIHWYHHNLFVAEAERLLLTAGCHCTVLHMALCLFQAVGHSCRPNGLLACVTWHAQSCCAEVGGCAFAVKDALSLCH